MSDLIEKHAAIDAVYEAFCYAYCDNCEKDMNEDLCGDCHRKYQNWAASKKAVESAINSVPSAQPETHWISCSDPSTLPKDRTFWVTHMNGYEAWVGELYWDMTEWSDRISDVVAYMPCNIPEPYQAEMRTYESD